MADPSTVSVVIPAFEEGAAVGDRRAGRSWPLRHWREVLVVDDGSADETALVAATGGRARHQASLQQGQRRRGQDRHPATPRRVHSDRRRRRPALRGRRAAADRISRRVRSRRRRAGGIDGAGVDGAPRRQQPAQLARELSHRAAPFPTSHPGLRAARTSGLREFLHLLPNGFSTPTTTTLSFVKAGYSVRFEPITVGARLGQSKIRLVSDGARFLPDPAEGHHGLQPAANFSADRGGGVRARRRLCRLDNASRRHDITDSSVLLIVLAVVIFLVGLVSEQISTMRSEGPR